MKLVRKKCVKEQSPFAVKIATTALGMREKINMDRIRNTSGNIDFSHIDFIVHKSVEEMIAHNTEDTIHNTLEYCMCNGVDFTKMTWDEVKELENQILNK